MYSKLNNIELTIGVYKKVPDIAVILGINYDCPKIVINNLKTNNPAAEIINGSESSALGFSLFEVMRDKLVGSPLEISRSRVSRIDCNSINKKLLITWNCQGTVSTLRKTIGLALTTLDPAKLYSKYAENMKLLGGSSDRSVFNFHAAEMISAIKKGIIISAVGKINIDSNKMKELLVIVNKKQPTITALPKETSKPPKHIEYIHKYPIIKASGIVAVAISDYIRSKSGGMGVDVFTDNIVVYNNSWNSKQKILNQPSRIKDYVRQKYEKLGDDFYLVFAYMSITQSYADCNTVSIILKTKLEAKSMIDLIKKNI